MKTLYVLDPIGRVESPLTEGEVAPKQGNEGAPQAWLVFRPEYEPALRELAAGDDVFVLTWLHRADRGTLRVHPRDDTGQPQRGVFTTRSQDRPNPVGLHRVQVVEVCRPTRVRVDGLEAYDGTPILDVKPVLEHEAAVATRRAKGRAVSSVPEPL
jgi:tRNA-Thr(GGU) m(6)t(6)A37 methyltransferase TsaA